ncbi:type II secretory pathway pseudopilin PulG [Paucibacter oligotrophus]|uniref:Type II secretory pathway pseudopilin PulG n=1 Tax=Roseateles oligotrophus TaxID=1769250 RepID=A0A840LGA4_9BURK|nr:type II secretion system protein [Roseateles oligotrophus]MBB4845069.1 type II secretory pathway pseudopilin PulG [Roseateles oligotrophus]
MAKTRQHYQAPLRRPQAQRGIALIEALVSMVLLAIVGLGLVYALGRSLVAQKYQKAQSLAVQTIRADLQGRGLADGCPSSGSNKLTRNAEPIVESVDLSGLSKACTIKTVTVDMAGISKTTTMAQVRYELEAQTLFGPGTLLLKN